MTLSQRAWADYIPSKAWVRTRAKDELETRCRHGNGHGHAARMRRRSHVAASRQRRKRRSQDRQIRCLRSACEDRLPDTAWRWFGWNLQSRRLDGAERAAEGR